MNWTDPVVWALIYFGLTVCTFAAAPPGLRQKSLLTVVLISIVWPAFFAYALGLWAGDIWRATRAHVAARQAARVERARKEHGS